MCLSPPGWTTVTVLCTASHNVKFHIYRDYKILQLGLLQTLVNSVIQLQHCDNITGLLLTFMSIPGLSPPYISEFINVKPKPTVSVHTTTLLYNIHNRKYWLHLAHAPLLLLHRLSATNCPLLLETLLR